MRFESKINGRLDATESVASRLHNADFNSRDRNAMNHDIHFRFEGYANYLSRKHQLDLLARQGSLPYHEQHDAMYQGTVKEVMERLCTLAGWSVYRPESEEIIARSDAAVVRVRTSVRTPLVACTLSVWAADSASGRDAVREFQVALGATANQPRSINVHWCFPTKSGFANIRVQEQVDEEIHSSAYPWLPQDLASFTRRFLESKEPVLVLYGPPGAGKTRLIRHLLAAMSDQAGEPARVLYTAEQKLVESDEFFVHFMTGDYSTMVIEDADYMLEPRKNGNRNLHRFLGASDGLLQPRGRRLIFSTNLPSKPDIDEALLRPGRCFGSFASRKLSVSEVRALMEDIAPDNAHRALALQSLFGDKQDRYALAEVYSAVRQTGPAEHGQELPEIARHLEAHPA